MRPGTRTMRSVFTPSAVASDISRVRVGIVAHRARVGRRDAGARQIDRGVERVAAEREAVAVVGAARELDHHFADADDAGFLLSHESPGFRNAAMKHGEGGVVFPGARTACLPRGALATGTGTSAGRFPADRETPHA